MHIVVAGPLNLPQLADFLSPSDGDRALQESTGNGTAPGLIVREYLKRGHRVTVVTYRQGEAEAEFTGPNLRVRRIDFSRPMWQRALGRWSAEIGEVESAIRDAGADVVHSQWPYEAALAAARSGVPHLATIRDAPLTVVKSYRSPMRVIRATIAYDFRLRSGKSRLSVVSPYLRDAWRHQMFDRREIDIIPNIVPLDMTARESLATRPTILEVSDSGTRKNVRKLILAFRQVRSVIPDAELRLVGRGLDASSEIAEWAAQHGVANGVVFRGPLERDRIRAEYSRAWVHAHASREETFGNTLVEAMAAGTAVVGGRDSGAVPWVLDHGAAGELVDVEDVGSFGAALVDLLSDHDRRAVLAAAGRASARARFGSDSVAASYEEVLEGLAQR
ncbi:glycosyltransferase involved in cell wall biosynthesis [Microbacterium ginsengiterrae]|uniref:Glycosyltransferase involved in cell wall biosynthesis n=1 Tax=Microbacterium ginsengiterrae TaxID=546115 RepID=A0A7W9CD58_9MICO|nr:glycosyltransferase involved in cell wall biosynthesis [Microbacterium ginsengiterrae]